MSPSVDRGSRGALLIVASAAPLHIALAAATDLSPDEAYYLCAARAPGFVPPLVDHPPLMPWLLRLSDRLPLLPVELRVRVWPIALSLLLGLVLIELARQRGADRAGRSLAAWLGTYALLPMTAGFVATPDGLSILAIAAGLLWAGPTPDAPASDAPASGARAGATDTLSGRAARTAAAGIALAAGALAKVVVLPAAGVVALLAAGKPVVYRALLLVPLALSFPLLLPSLQFQLDHAFAEKRGAWGIAGAARALTEAALVQAILWSPWVLARGLRVARSLPAADLGVLGAITGLVALSALVRATPPEANWWAPAALIVVVAAARSPAQLTRRGRRALIATVALPTAIAVVHTLHPFLPLQPEADPTARLHGWSRGQEPRSAAGVGPYGPAAERCVYQGRCDEIAKYFERLNSKASSSFESP